MNERDPQGTPGGGALVALDARLVHRIVDDAIARYVDERRRRAAAFVDRHFSWRGSVALHGHAVGWDLLRAPINLVVALPQSVAVLAGTAGRGLGRTHPRIAAVAERLRRSRLLLETDVGRALTWLIHTELLELPIRQGDRVATRDALAETVFSDPRLAGAIAELARVVGRRSAEPGFEARLTALIAGYTGSRTAAAEIATSLFAVGAGMATARQFTPGALTLGPAIAGALAHHAAVASFPLGTNLGALWYAAFPPAALPGLALAASGTAFLAMGTLSAFAGVVTDPVQRRLGLHRRRLHRLIDEVEALLRGREPAVFRPRDHYVARVFDMLDVIRSLHRLAHS